jgi:hypothetical protein
MLHSREKHLNEPRKLVDIHMPTSLTTLFHEDRVSSYRVSSTASLIRIFKCQPK